MLDFFEKFAIMQQAKTKVTKLLPTDTDRSIYEHHFLNFGGNS